MKKYVLPLAIVLLLAAGSAQAQTDASSTQVSASSTTMASYNPTLLPTSQFYFIKEWWRGLKLLLTRDPAKKIELNLQFLDEKAAEAKAIFETKSKNLEALSSAAENYTASKKRLEDTLDSLKNNPNVSKLKEKADAEIQAHTVLFQSLGEKILEERSSGTTENNSAVGNGY